MAEASGGDRRGRRGSFATFAACYAPGFSLSFLGTALVLVWIQCILYARYIWVDSGLTTVAINFARCLCIVALGAVALRRPFSPTTQNVLGWASTGLMTAGSLLFFVESLFPHLPFTLLAAVCSGVGLAWGGGMWINFYIRLDLREALLVAFASLALSTVIGIFIGIMEENTAFFISMMLPATTFVMYLRAQEELDDRERCGIAASAPDNVYATEPASTLLRLILGIALFSFVLGVSRGFPSGESIKLSAPFHLIQHVSVTVAGFAIIWWVLIRGRGFKFSVLWQIQLAALALGVVMLSTLDPLASEAGATLIAATNLFQVGFLWFVSYDVARHRSLPPYLILGFFWFLHLFFRESGRLVMWWLGGTSGIEMLIIAGLVCLLAVSVGALLSDSIPRNRPLFAEVSDRSSGAVENENGEGVPRSAMPGGAVSPAIPKEERGTAVFPAISSPAVSPSTPSRFETYVHECFGLTNREVEVLLLLAEGRSSSYIAEELVLSANTVRGYVKNIYQKLDVHSKQDVIDFAKSFKD